MVGRVSRGDRGGSVWGTGKVNLERDMGKGEMGMLVWF
jgi:hypothetical protein